MRANGEGNGVGASWDLTAAGRSIDTCTLAAVRAKSGLKILHISFYMSLSYQTQNTEIDGDCVYDSEFPSNRSALIISTGVVRYLNRFAIAFARSTCTLRFEFSACFDVVSELHVIEFPWRH